MAGGPFAWGRLTKGDLSGFDDTATSVVLYAMDRGGEGRISRRGHAILRNVLGQTMSVSPDSRRSKQVMEINVRKVFGGDGIAAEKQKPRKAARKAVETVDSMREALTSAIEDPTLECPAKGCEAVFVTEGARYSHIDKDHLRCPVVGCSYVARNAQALGPHKATKHGGSKPWLAAKKKRLTDEQHTAEKDATPAIPPAKTTEGCTCGFLRDSSDPHSAQCLARSGARNATTETPQDSATETSAPSVDDHKAAVNVSPEASPTRSSFQPLYRETMDMLEGLDKWLHHEREHMRSRLEALEHENARLRERLDEIRRILD